MIESKILSEDESWLDHENWNIFRKAVIDKLIDDFMIPKFNEEIKKELTKAAEKKIIKICGLNFR